MTIEAIARDREETRFAQAGVADDALGCLVHQLDIGAVDDHAIEPESTSALVECEIGGGAIDPRAHAILVVDADENHRQRPQRRQVHALVEDALLHGAVAIEGDRDARLFLALVGEGGSDRMRDAASDDGIGAEMAEAHVGDVHRSALAAAIAVGLAGDLRQHARRLGPARHEDAVAAMMGGEAVLRVHGADDAGYALFADREMQHRAGALRPHEQLADPLLQRADATHVAVKGMEQLVVGGHRVSRTFFSAA